MGNKQSQGGKNQTQQAKEGLYAGRVEQVAVGLKSFPIGLVKNDDVESVNLSCNSIAEIPELQCGKLLGLLLWGNKITSASGLKVHFLRVLDLGNNALTEFPNLSQCVHLTDLNLSGNRIKVASPEAVAICKNMQVLKLQFNQLESLPDEIGTLSKLQRLHVYCNRLQTLPSTLALCTNLVELRVAENKIASVPDDLFTNLNSITVLDMSRNELHRVPCSVWALTNLENLLLHHNSISDWGVPTDITLTGLCRLTNINMASNRLTDMPPHLPPLLVAVVTLNLGRNCLESLPNTMPAMRDVSKLNLSCNKLTTLPPNIGEMKSLRELELQNNNFGQGPPGSLDVVGTCSLLVMLDLGYNQLTALPASLGKMSFLNRLCAPGNLLEDVTALPPSMASETNPLPMTPRFLDLSCNQFKEIPAVIPTLRGIESLFLHGNPFSTLPSPGMLGRLPSLTRLTLSAPPAPFVAQPLVDAVDNHPALERMYLVARPTPLLLEAATLQALPPSDGSRWINRHMPALTAPLLHCRIGHYQATGKTMHALEDTLAAAALPGIDKKSGGMDYVAVFDGHGGEEAAQYMQENMHLILQGVAAKNAGTIGAEGLIEAFALANSQFKRTLEDLDHSAGTTAGVLLITRTQLLCANAGDSRVVVAVTEDPKTVSADGFPPASTTLGQFTAHDLSYDHKPGLPQERERIRADGAYVTEPQNLTASMYCRLSIPRKEGGFHSLGVARSLGDFHAAPALTGVPTVEVYNRTGKESFAIVACDGVWDVMSSQEAVDLITPLVAQGNDWDCSEAAAWLCHRAAALGSADDLSALVIAFS
eukprot:comp21953_c0_seq1/m.31643 comp21953_c0_seq1/g.31643  ORF comp21953_c0_seq1/g.31643 comp21953_c0_seq1/m.31643 type:complete len:819 (-) comp21953_c0_seq1:455-2911(-)